MIVCTQAYLKIFALIKLIYISPLFLEDLMFENEIFVTNLEKMYNFR